MIIAEPLGEVWVLPMCMMNLSLATDARNVFLFQHISVELLKPRLYTDNSNLFLPCMISLLLKDFCFL